MQTVPQIQVKGCVFFFSVASSSSTLVCWLILFSVYRFFVRAAFVTLSPNDALKRALKLAKDKGPLCEAIKSAPPTPTPIAPAASTSPSDSVAASEPKKICDHCSQICESSKICGKCKTARYCSPKCQKSAWDGGHKATCAAPTLSAVKPATTARPATKVVEEEEEKTTEEKPKTKADKKKKSTSLAPSMDVEEDSNGDLVMWLAVGGTLLAVAGIGMFVWNKLSKK